MRVETKDEKGQHNGYVVTIWNCHEQDWRPDQVYLTVIAPRCQKGPHLHLKRCGRFVCIKGNVEIITRRGMDPKARHGHWRLYERHWSGQNHDYKLVHVPPGTAAALINHEDEPAFVINMPTPAWKPDDQDEWPVEGWRP